jgi:hypothetical protein
MIEVVKENPPKDIWRANLATIELMIRADGDIELTLDHPDPGELIKSFDDWNPEYENTHVAMAATRILEDGFHDIQQNLIKNLRGFR